MMQDELDNRCRSLSGSLHLVIFQDTIGLPICPYLANHEQDLQDFHGHACQDDQVSLIVPLPRLGF